MRGAVADSDVGWRARFPAGGPASRGLGEGWTALLWTWLGDRSGHDRPAAATLGNAEFRPLGVAPGAYVMTD